MSDEILIMSGLQIDAHTADGETRTLVNGIDLRLHRGEILGLIGESGAGKTTLGLAALAYTRSGCSISGGEIRFNDIDVRSLTRKGRRKLRGRRIAYVAQSAAASFDPAKSLTQQVCEMPVRHGLMTLPEARRQAVALFRELDLPSPETFGERFPHQVSGGQLQRAMLAMAMSCRPEIVVFDEPTTALDVTTQIEVLAAIRKLVREHRTAGLYISHDLAVVAQVATSIMVLRNGKVVELGDAPQILHAPRKEYTQRLVAVRASEDTPSATSKTRAAESVLVLDGVSASYSTVKVVNNASLQIRRGETLAVVGESGSGKSSLARVICGLKPKEQGTIRFEGKDLQPDFRKRTPDQLRRIQMIYQMPDLALNPRQSIGEILARPLEFYFKWPAAQVKARVRELLTIIDLGPEFADRLPGQLSGGQKQRVCIARALAANPDVIICDEVTSALDPLLADEILRLIKRLQNETGVACLFITHDLGTVRRIADQVAVMLRGDIIAQGPLKTIFSPPYHPYVEKLISSVPEMRTDWLDDTLARRASGPGSNTRMHVVT